MAARHVVIAQVRADKARPAGNKVTQEKILLQEMVIHVGDAIDTERIERSRQAIMNLGLFKSVTATVEEGNVLLITVEERYYILPFPLLDARPEGNYSYGAEMRFDNIAGLNQHLKLTYEEKDSVASDTPHSKESSITYSYPRLGGSAYQLDFASRLKRWQFPWPDKFAPQAHYGIDNWNTSLGVSRWGNDEGISRGWRFGGGISHQINDYTLLDGIARSLKKGDPITFVGFGTFKTSLRKARTARNPQTGAAIKIPKRRVVRFTAGKALKMAVNK